MNCPACHGTLREKSAAGMTLDVCYGGCGGIWFDAKELERVDARAATTLHTVWQHRHQKRAATEPRLCPRCPSQVLDRQWFSNQKHIEIDQCPRCGGIWLDNGEFTLIYKAIKMPRLSPPGWAVAMAEAAALVKGETVQHPPNGIRP